MEALSFIPFPVFFAFMALILVVGTVMERFRVSKTEVAHMRLRRKDRLNREELFRYSRHHVGKLKPVMLNGVDLRKAFEAHGDFLDCGEESLNVFPGIVGRGPQDNPQPQRRGYSLKVRIPRRYFSWAPRIYRQLRRTA